MADTPETWIILGASSTIARVFARLLAAEGAALVLCGRDTADIEAQAADCRLRGATSAEALTFDCRDTASFAPILDRARASTGPVCAAVFTGSMPPQADVDATPEIVAGVVADSHTGPATFLQMLAPLLEERGSGIVVGVSSVAGDRGRLPNYVYGSAKAGFTTYLSGLRNRLARSGGHVLTVKPGPVDTAMTWGLPGMDKAAPPEAVAGAILKAARRGTNVLYTPFIWRIIMSVIRAIPEPVFKKLKI